MHRLHGAPESQPIALLAKSGHTRMVETVNRNDPMSVRAVWRMQRLVDIKQTLREMDVPSTRDADMLGISGPDFSKMTRGLFDRKP